MSYHIYDARGSELYDITEITGDMEWGDSTDSIGADMSLTVFTGADFKVQGKDILILRNEEDELFRGIVSEATDPLDGTVSCRLYDFAYFMGKSTIIIQFNSVRADEAVKQVCSRCGIECVILTEMTAVIKKVYFNEHPSDIIKDIVSQDRGENDQNLYMEMRGSVFCIYPPFEVTGTFKPADNIAEFDVANTPSSPVITESISGISNSVVVVSGSAESYRIIAEARDDKDISVSGLRQTVEVIEEKNISQAANIAKNRLKEQSSINRTLTTDMPGADNVRSGRIITYEDEENNIFGKYLITNCRHSIKDGIHTLSADMTKWGE